jgi:hypothetical protein
MEIKINYERPTDLIAADYCDQRPIMLVIDWDRKEIYADTIAQHERNSTPGRVWHELVTRYTLNPNVDATALADWVREEILPICAKLLGVYATEWDGSNQKGTWKESVESGEDVEQLLQEIENLCYHGAPELHGDAPGLWDIREWAAPTKEELNAGTTNEQIQALAKEIESAADAENVVLCGPDLREWLTEKRDELAEGAE